MRKISRLFLFGALALILLTTACAGQQATPTATAQATFTAINLTSTSTTTPLPTMTTTSTATSTAGIPVTGLTASLICQFCMDTVAHALLVIPAAATVTVLTPSASVSPATNVSTGCGAVETLNDKQLVLCRGQSNTSLNLNICAGTNCQQFTVRLQTCPPLPIPAATRTSTATFTLTPALSETPTSTHTANPAASPTPTSTPHPTDTPTSSPTSTSTASATATP